METFRTKTLNSYKGDEEKTNTYLTSNDNYQELLKLKVSLENIDNGYYDPDLLRKQSRAQSSSTQESSGSANGEKLQLALALWRLLQPMSPQYLLAVPEIATIQ